MFSLNKLPWMSGTDGQEKVHVICSCPLTVQLAISYLIVLKVIIVFELGKGKITHYGYYHILQVVLTAAEVESLRSELGALEEREAHCKAQ